MTDEFACVCNLMDDDLQKDWYANGEKYSHEAVEAALYAAYEQGARKHRTNYAKCLDAIKMLKNFVNCLNGHKANEFVELIRELEDNLDDPEPLQVWLFHHRDYDHISDYVVGTEDDANERLNEIPNKEDFWIEGPLEIN